MTAELARKLLATGVVPRSGMQAALFHSVRHGVPLGRALIQCGAIDEAALMRELHRTPAPQRELVPLDELVDRLPTGLCARLLAVPVSTDPDTSTVELAALDPTDSHTQAEFEFHLQAPVHLIAGALDALDDALRTIDERTGSGSRYDGRSTLPFEPDDVLPSLPEAPIPLVRRSLVPRAPAPSRHGGALPERDLRPGPLGPPQPLDATPLLSQLRSSRSRDEVVDMIVQVMRTAATRVGVLVLRKGAFAGWLCTPELADPEAFRALRVPADVPSALSAAARDGSFEGQLEGGAPHEPLSRLLGEPPLPVSLVAVKVADRTAMLIMSTAHPDSAAATRLAALAAHDAGGALNRILQADKRSR